MLEILNIIFYYPKIEAKEVYKYLKSMGISENRLSYKGCGESHPILVIIQN